MFCFFCNKEINNKGSLISHQNSCKQNPNGVPKKRSPLAGRKKGTKRSSRVPCSEEHKQKLRNVWKTKDRSTIRQLTFEEELLRRNRISKSTQGIGGGYRENSGRGKKAWCSGIHCQSTWELAFVYFHIRKDISIQRYKGHRTYVYKDEIRKYYPDFIVGDKVFEIKGYITEEVKAKIEANPDIILIDKCRITPYLDFIKQELGKNYLSYFIEKTGKSKPTVGDGN